MRIAVDDFPEQGFVAGQPNQLSFWIGPEVVSDLVARASDAVTETGQTLNLDARFSWPGGEETAQTTLSADPTQRSDPKFVVTVDIPANATRFRGTLHLWVRETARLYEHVKVIGAASVQSHGESPQLLSIVEDRDQFDSARVESSGACLIHEGDALLWYTGTEPAVFDATGFATVLDDLSSAVANLQARSGLVDWTDERAIALLRTLAIEGSKLRHAVAGKIDPGEAFQFYNHQTKSSIPLEWVYDRGHTAADAVLKSSCLASLKHPVAAQRATDDPFPCGCPAASMLSTDVMFSNPILCPWGFWGLAKVIERYDVEPDIFNNIARADGDGLLPPITSILLGANETLDLPSGRPGEQPIDLVRTLSESVTTNRVHTWLDWRTHLAGGSSNLVVTLPHQDRDSLQIGTDRLMLSQVPSLLSEHLDGIILLLGCKTSQPVAEGFASFTRLFKDHAAVVIGSSATLVTSDAARLAIELVHQLVEVAKTDQPLGTAIVHTRRAMFANGLPIALAVTAIGDADWRFATEHQPLVPV